MIRDVGMVLILLFLILYGSTITKELIRSAEKNKTCIKRNVRHNSTPWCMTNYEKKERELEELILMENSQGRKVLVQEEDDYGEYVSSNLIGIPSVTIDFAYMYNELPEKYKVHNPNFYIFDAKPICKFCSCSLEMIDCSTIVISEPVYISKEISDLMNNTITFSFNIPKNGYFRSKIFWDQDKILYCNYEQYVAVNFVLYEERYPITFRCYPTSEEAEALVEDMETYWYLKPLNPPAPTPLLWQFEDASKYKLICKYHTPNLLFFISFITCSLIVFGSTILFIFELYEIFSPMKHIFVFLCG